MDIQSMRKLFSITTVLQIILIGGCSNQSESNDIDIVDKMPGSNVVEVMLIDNIDEARGYCLDVAGGQGARAPIERGLQAHTCYHYKDTILEDQGFDPVQIKDGQFRLAYFDVCVTVSSFSAGVPIALAPCDASVNQQFELTADGRIVPQSEPALCITVSDTQKKEGRGGTPVHVMRPVSLQPCSDSSQPYQTWMLNSL